MNLRYSLTAADYTAFSLWYFRNTPENNQAMQRVQFRSGGLCLFVLGVAYFIMPSLAPFLLLVLLAVIALYALVYPKRYRSQIRQQVEKIYADPENAAMFGDRTLELSPDGVMSVSDVTTALHKWSLVSQIAVTDQYAFLMMGRFTGTVIPRATVTEGNFEAFVAEAQRLHAEETGSPNPVPLRLPAR